VNSSRVFALVDLFPRVEPTLGYARDRLTLQALAKR
jgi:hypothetical protein